jgi:polar amino acid transport system substrate-binding protein
MTSRLARVASTVSLAVALTGLAACGSSTPADKKADAGLPLVTAGTLTVCSDVPYAPFEDFDKTSRSGFTGFDVDVVQHIADGLGLKLAVKDSSFDALQSGLALNSRQCDLVASAMTITPDRAKHLAFSDGYYDSAQSLLVPAGAELATLGDLDGKRIGVQADTTGKTYADEHAKGAQIVSFPSDAEMYAALKAGSVDALLQDLPVNLGHQNDTRQKGRFLVVETYTTDESYGLAAKLGNTKLVTAVDKQLAAMRKDGSYKTIYDTYFAIKK